MKTRLFLFAFCFLISTFNAYSFTEFVDPNPSAGNNFGRIVVPLSTGNVVITAPNTDRLGVTDVGAVYLFNGATGELISALYGSSAGDIIGSESVIALANGNFVVVSYFWDNGAATDVGAVTWGSGKSGVSGIVSASNSLVGSTTNDYVGKWGGSAQSGPVYLGVTALSNGNYVVCSPLWDNATITDAGAVTWGDGTTGVSGVVSSANSLIGSTANDKVGGSASGEGNGIVALTGNGNFVINSGNWQIGSKRVGAITWVNGSTGATGTVSTSNSLVGSTDIDLISTKIIPLTNGNYVVNSPGWNNTALNPLLDNVGAVTWGNGSIGTSGEITSANSLIGGKINDNVGSTGVIALTNGNYVVCSNQWDNGTITDVGAATWCIGLSGLTGYISSFNSLIGTSSSDAVGSRAIALTNGNFVVYSSWITAAKRVGAVTWGSGTSGLSGQISSFNSLVGSTNNDGVGMGLNAIIPLTNGNYVVKSTSWQSGGVAIGAVTWCSGSGATSGAVSSLNSMVGTKPNQIYPLKNGNYVLIDYTWKNGTVTNAGAVTWCNGEVGTIGTVDATNSLVGNNASAQIGMSGITELSNGNYVIGSQQAFNESGVLVGAATWANGLTGITGTVNSSNSLIGSTNSDMVGYGMKALSNGNYVVLSYGWDNGAVYNVGAVTLCNGNSGTIGTISAANSLIGSKNMDQVGFDGIAPVNSTITPLANGNYVIKSPLWDNGTLVDAGATTFGNGTSGIVGPVNLQNSIVGSIANSKLTSIIADDVNGNYYVTFQPTTYGGRVLVGNNSFLPTSVENSKNSSINIYSKNKTIYVESPQSGTLEVFDLTGKICLTRNVNRGLNTFQVNNSGVFLVKLKVNSNPTISKIIL